MTFSLQSYGNLNFNTIKYIDTNQNILSLCKFPIIQIHMLDSTNPQGTFVASSLETSHPGPSNFGNLPSVNKLVVSHVNLKERHWQCRNVERNYSGGTTAQAKQKEAKEIT
jgi:hypothetical protein